MNNCMIKLRSYDGIFLLRALWKYKLKDITIILNSNKILKIEVGNIRFIDSLSFFQLPLSQLTKCFNLTQRKGYFPYLAITNETFDKLIDFPEKKQFGYDNMKPDQKADFEIWYESQSIESQYDVKNEMLAYCKSDVELLFQAVVAFRRQFFEITSIDPIVRCFTLASIGLELFKSSMLTPKTIGATPANNYKLRNSSAAASAWLDMKEHEYNTLISREVRVGKYYADGAILESRNIFEFYGCFYHGCPCHFGPHDTVPLVGKSASLLREEVRIKELYYREIGFNVESIWECQVNRSLEYNSRVEYHKKLANEGGCDLRQSYYGGRVENIKFNLYSTSEETIRYLDITSQYPYVLKNRRFPLAHPIRITRNFDDSLNSYFGFAKITILPPKYLFFPVLPMKINGKLVFALCESCAYLKQLTNCTHSDDERKLTSTWCIPEIKLALSKGYVMMEIHEVLHYTKTSKTLFKPYINKWLKEKTEASGEQNSIYPLTNIVSK